MLNQHIYLNDPLFWFYFIQLDLIRSAHNIFIRKQKHQKIAAIVTRGQG